MSKKYVRSYIWAIVVAAAISLFLLYAMWSFSVMGFYSLQLALQPAEVPDMFRIFLVVVGLVSFLFAIYIGITIGIVVIGYMLKLASHELLVSYQTALNKMKFGFKTARGIVDIIASPDTT